MANANENGGFIGRKTNYAAFAAKTITHIDWVNDKGQAQGKEKNLSLGATLDQFVSMLRSANIKDEDIASGNYDLSEPRKISKGLFV